jgi:hypothetical protein
MSAWSNPLPLRSLDRFPWASFGREESPEAFERRLETQRQRIDRLSDKPLVSLVLPLTGKGRRKFFAQALDALVRQSYPYWEVILVYRRGLPGPADTAVKDPRVRRLVVPPSATDVELANLGAAKARGKWLGFLSPDDLLSPVALYELMEEASRHPGTALFYPNEARVDPLSSRATDFLSKPEFSWLDLLHFNYVGSFWLVSREWFGSIGGFDEHAAPFQSHDFLLRLSEKTQAFRSIPFFLHYRRFKSSVLPPDARWTARLQAHLERRGLSAQVCLNAGQVQLIPEVQEPKRRLAVLVGFPLGARLAASFWSGLARQVGKVPVEVCLVGTPAQREEMRRSCQGALAAGLSAGVVVSDPPFPVLGTFPLALSQLCPADYYFFLNPQVELHGKGLIDEAVAWAQLEGVGTVGLRLRGAVTGWDFPPAWAQGSASDGFSGRAHGVFGNHFAALVVKRTIWESWVNRNPPFSWGELGFHFEGLQQGCHHWYLGHREGWAWENPCAPTSEEGAWELEREYPEIWQKLHLHELRCDRLPPAERSPRQLVREAWRETALRVRPWVPRKLLSAAAKAGDNLWALVKWEKNENASG